MVRLGEAGSLQFGVLSTLYESTFIAAVYTAVSTASCGNHGAAPNFK